MTRLHSLALATASALAATAAQSADLPSKKAAPVEYLRICKVGEKFTGFVIPGSDTCLVVGGRIRSEYYYNERFYGPSGRGFSQNVSRFRARGYVSLDAMTPTEYGPVRAAVRIYGQQTTGATPGSTSSDGTYLDYAYIQFAGFTAGRYLQSWFDFAFASGINQTYIGGNSNGRGSDASGAITPPSFAYTAKFDKVSATLAFEDGSYRQSGLYKSLTGMPTSSSNNVAYGGVTVPDVVGRLQYDDSWGTVALSGAIHQVRPNADMIGVDTAYGFALLGGVKVNLPFLAAGDNFVGQIAYADGANAYTGFATYGALGESVQAGARKLITADATLVGNALKLTQTWQGYAGIQHYWTPAITSVLFAAYGDYNAYGKTADAKIVSVGTRLAWTPVKKLEFGTEVIYSNFVDTPAGFLNAGNGNRYNRSDWSGRIRVQRDF